MSLTSTSTVDRTSTVYLSPSKRRRRSPSPDQTAKKGSSIKDIFNWTFLGTAIASCSIRDALEMRENTLERREFFWLGSVPCSFVKLVGMIVGVQVYEKRIMYTVDDGTGVIDCSHKPAHQTLAFQRTEPPLPLKPIGKVGNFVQVTGRVQLMPNSRQISVKDMELCSSANDELAHTRTVRHLHRTSYSRTEPFTISPHQPLFKTPKKSNVLDMPSTMYSSPISSIASSPVKPEQIEQSHKSPIKLRHPSRLHTHDLTENTFRIYLKHYMDYAPIFRLPSDAGYDSDAGIGYSISQLPSTPTKFPRSDETPCRRRAFDATPKARIPALDFGNATASASSLTLLHTGSEPDTHHARSGFSLSYLRRVPELSLLASRVVEAVGRRKVRDERHRMKAAGVLPSRSQKFKAPPLAIPPDKFAGKKKRLFQWAIIQLLKEGCIVHWDGPVRSCPDTSIMDTTRLWKANTTSTTQPSDNTLFSLTSSSVPRPDIDEIDDGALSDPDSTEEAYISLTPEYLSDFVERAITVLVNHYEKIGKPYTGATKDGILSVLRKDDRWQYVGEWNVDDALDFLKKEGRVWCMGKGRWDLTG
ncbi:hypothetical protein GALMADRAFT_155343 [Galerina marginata CBS 339.88]|uniref:CST complex subunit STN1 n=1 Tax=Galerina marginata (strain CBS 339.88) TaxID=685588 RepID=A0A067T5F5_GALM3|nr:hypothetical protein GALMADRAFT_155343 [Galerina marginata CBS 339.88]